jgi:hypothetical protein
MVAMPLLIRIEELSDMPSAVSKRLTPSPWLFTHDYAPGAKDLRPATMPTVTSR